MLAVLLCSIGAVQAADVLQDQTTTSQKLQEIYGTTDVVWTGSDTETELDYSRNTLNYSSNKAYGMLKIAGSNDGHSPSLSISKYQDVSFDKNTSTAKDYVQGTSIHLAGDTRKTTTSINALLSIKDNGNVSFDENKGISKGTFAYGGALYMSTCSNVEITENDSVSFSNNLLQSNNYVQGGAIYVTQGSSYDYGERNSCLDISGNTDVNFTNNIAYSQGSSTNAGYGMKASGGAIYAADNAAVNLNNNTGKVEFRNNGVIYKNNTDKNADKNGTLGGAIYLVDSAQLSVRGNNEVVFAGNYELNTYDGKYSLRSIYAKGEHVALSANEGGKIEFQDSIQVNGNVSLNEDFEGKAQTGKIIFTGKNTVTDLLALEDKLNDFLSQNAEEGTAPATATADVTKSRTNIINGNIILNNGTLSLQDQTILQAKQVTIKSGATFEAILTSAPEMVATFSLEEATIAATLDADLILEDNSTFTLDGGLIDMANNNVTLGDGVTLIVRNLDSADDDMVTLFTNINELSIDNKAAESGAITMNINGVEQEVTYDATNGIIKVSADAIPEPTTATLSLLALAALAARRRRR